MSETYTPTDAPGRLHIHVRLCAVPLLLFLSVFFGLLLLSYALLLPRFTSFHTPDGTALSPREMAEYQKTLAANLSAAEDERIRLVMPVQDSGYDALKQKKTTGVFLAELPAELRAITARIGEQQDAFFIESLTLNATTGNVMLKGDIRNVGPRSMTVLASFIEELEKMPGLTNFERPPFARTQDADGKFHSAFDLTFTLASASQ